MPMQSCSTPNTSDTNRKVPMDWTKVMPRICLPVLASFLNRISRPIITPAKHSKTLIAILYHIASTISADTTPAR